MGKPNDMLFLLGICEVIPWEPKRAMPKFLVFEIII
jgi:hypothetical protein